VIQSNSATRTLLQVEGSGGPPKKKKIKSDTLIALAFIAPAFLALLIMRILPAIFAFVESLNKTNVFTLERKFVGLRNYIQLFDNPEFVNTIKVTLLFTLIVNPVQIFIAILLAILFTRRFPLSGIFRSLVIFPIAVPPAVSAVVWSAIYRPDGLANAILKGAGLPEQEWIISSSQSLMSIIILLSWIGCGYWMLFLIAGINDIPDEIYEASKLDGAGFIRQTWSVTLPLLRRPLAFVLVADTVSNFLIFAPVAILTNGGPEGSTSLLMFDIFTRAYSYGDVGKAAAAVFILIIFMLIAVIGQFAMLRSKD
jgi:ABC-type sugar transport system permease subunit